MKLAHCIDMVRRGLLLLPTSMSNKFEQVLVAMLSIGLQESLFIHRYQVLNTPGVKGPARGFWQFEQGGGVKGLMAHSATKKLLKEICAKLGVPFTQQAIWLALETNDELAVVCARLLLYSDHRALPKTNDVEAMWQYYLRNWRPGAYFNGTLEERIKLHAKFVANHLVAQKETTNHGL